MNLMLKTVTLLLHLYLCRLPCPIFPINGPKQGTFDYYVLVCEDLDWSIPAWDFLKTPILEAAKVLIHPYRVLVTFLLNYYVGVD